MGRFLPISPQTLKGCRGQLDARISIKTGSIDRSAHEVDRSSSSRASRSFPRISRHLPMLMSSLHLTKTCTMPPQVWRAGARVSRPHPTQLDPLQPGQKRRRRPAQYGTRLHAVPGETGRFRVRWDDGSEGEGSIKGAGRMELLADGAGRHNRSPLPQS
jgi:hypothetical protein